MQDKTNTIIGFLEKNKLTEQELHKVKTEIQSIQFDPNIKDSAGYTPLMWAAANGHSSITRTLINDERSRLDVQDTNGSTVAHFAVQGGDISIVEELLDKKLDFIGQNKLGNTPLHYLAAEKYDHATLEKAALIVERLVELGTDIHAKDHNNLSPIHQAVFNMSLEDINRLF